MKLTPAAANLLVAACDRSDRLDRAIALTDGRAALDANPKQANDLLRKLKR